MSTRRTTTAALAAITASTSLIAMPVAHAQSEQAQQIASETAGTFAAQISTAATMLGTTALPTEVGEPYRAQTAHVVRQFSDTAQSRPDMRSDRTPRRGGPSADDDVRSQIGNRTTEAPSPDAPVATGLGNTDQHREALPPKPREDRPDGGDAAVDREDLTPEARAMLTAAEDEARARGEQVPGDEPDPRRAPEQSPEREQVSDNTRGQDGQGQDQETTDQNAAPGQGEQPRGDGENHEGDRGQTGNGEHADAPADRPEHTTPAPEPEPAPLPQPCDAGVWPIQPGFDIPQQIAELVEALWVEYGGTEFAPSFYIAPLDKQYEVAMRVLADHDPSSWPQCAPAPAPAPEPEPAPLPPAPQQQFAAPAPAPAPAPPMLPPPPVIEIPGLPLG